MAAAEKRLSVSNAFSHHESVAILHVLGMHMVASEQTKPSVRFLSASNSCPSRCGSCQVGLCSRDRAREDSVLRAICLPSSFGQVKHSLRSKENVADRSWIPNWKNVKFCEETPLHVLRGPMPCHVALFCVQSTCSVNMSDRPSSWEWRWKILTPLPGLCVFEHSSWAKRSGESNAMSIGRCRQGVSGH